MFISTKLFRKVITDITNFLPKNILKNYEIEAEKQIKQIWVSRMV